MAENDIPLHQEDDLVLDGNFDFSNSMFDLQEPEIPTLPNTFLAPSSYINLKLKNYQNLFRLGHINARSVPKHIHEIAHILEKTKLDALGSSETFISDNTPHSIFQIPGYKFYNKNRDKQCRGGVGIWLDENYPAKIIKLATDLVQPEMIFIEVTVGLAKIALGCIYKSPLIP